MESINERQMALYEYLLRNNRVWSTKEKICADLDEYYHREGEKSNDHNSTAFSVLRKDIDVLNRSDAYKIIVSSKVGYKIATPEEAQEYINSRMFKDMRSLRKTRLLQRKMKLNRQMSMTNAGYVEVKTYIKGE